MKPQEIEVTFTQEDFDKAEDYCLGESCILATALKRMGHPAIVGGKGEFHLGKREGWDDEYEYEALTPFGYDIACLDSSEYDPNLVGKTFKFGLRVPS